MFLPSYSRVTELKSLNSKYQARGSNMDRHSYKAVIAAAIITNHC